MKILIKNIFDNIDINPKNIFYDTVKNKKKIKPEYIIPYKYDSKNIIIQIIKKSDIDTKTSKNFNIIHNENKSLIQRVINEIYDKTLYLNLSTQIININKPNYKNILACFLFYIIRLVYDICKEYIKQIDDVLRHMIESKDKRFKKLNINNALKYTSALTKSLLKFKLVLLNNFYHLFLPSKITGTLYGMQRDTNNCYIPIETSIFSRDDNYILDNYPFNQYDIIPTNIVIIDPINYKDILSKFILTISEKNDIYDSNDILYLGGFVFNSKIMNYSNKILNNYYKFLQKYNNFTLFIIDKIIYNFNIKKNIPCELISDLYNLENDMLQSNKLTLTPTNKDRIKHILINKYDNLLEQSTKYYKKTIDIRNKIKLSKKYNINNLYNLEEIYFLCFNIYLVRALCYIPITTNLVSNTILKNQLLMEYSKIKKKYENIIINYQNK